jgi:hypothetical protein
MELRPAAEIISGYMLTSHVSLQRLEKLEQPPTRRAQRALAYLAVLTYGFDPEDFGLTAADLPKEMQVTGLVEPGGLLRGRDSNSEPND